MDRRTFLKTTLAGAGGLALGAPAFGRRGGDRDERPNIVLIMADDLGFSDIAPYGGEIATPNLDALARGGMRFSRFYNYARCCPTRASLMTGLHPHQAGMGHMAGGSPYADQFIESLDDPAYQGYLNRRCITMAEVLQSAGYQTMMTGKWHLGDQKEHWPTRRGFERYFGLIQGASNYFDPGPDKDLVYNDQPFDPPADFYTTDYFANYGARFIREAESARPFFLYTAFTAPHWPLHAWPEDIARYKGYYLRGWDQLRKQRYDRQKQMGILDPMPGLSPRNPEAPAWAEVEDKEGWAHRMAVYAAMVDRMDRGIGQLVQSLKESGRYENTLILFLSDNGGCAEHYNPVKGVPAGPEESGTAYYLPWANASNTPFRLFKHWTHEGGISTPLIAHWPDGIEAKNTINRSCGTVLDLMPTLTELAGAEYPDRYQGAFVQPPEGESLTQTIKTGEYREHSPMYWNHEGNRAVRDGKWKLVSYFGEARSRGAGRGERTGQWQLYDLEKDRTELHDLRSREPERAEQMIGMYEAFAERVGVIDWETVNRKTGRL